MHAMQQRLSQKHQILQSSNTRLNAKNPVILLQQAKSHLQYLENSLIQQADIKINRLKQQFTAQLATLHAVSPLATLDRGYAIASRNNKVILNSQIINIGDVIDIRLSKGTLTSKIISKR